jgi:TusA-related sulfurtransferase
MLFLANIAGFLVAKWRLIAVIIGLFVVVFGTALLWKRCNPPPKLDEKQIQKAQNAIAKQDRDEMIKVLAESDAAESNIDETIKVAEQHTETAKQNYTGKSNDELAEELNRRAQQP